MRSARRGYRFLIGFAVLACIAFAQTPERRQGDWIVKASETVENKSIVLAGNLVVEAGGALTLRNVTFSIEQAGDKLYRIEARPGSTLTIAGCTFRPATKSGRFEFLVQGARFRMENSQLEGVGGVARESFGGGFAINQTDGAMLEGNTFLHDLSGGVSLQQSNNAILRRNTFRRLAEQQNWAIQLQESHGNQIVGNRMELENEAVILDRSFDNYIAENDVTAAGQTAGIVVSGGSGNNMVTRNRVTSLTPGNT